MWLLQAVHSGVRRSHHMADSLDLQDRLCDVAVWECCLKARGFSNGVWLLQAVHSGADLQASAKEASGVMPQGAKDHLGYVLGHQRDHEVLPLMQNAVEARTEIAQSGQLAGNRWGILSTRDHHISVATHGATATSTVKC